MVRDINNIFTSQYVAGAIVSYPPKLLDTIEQKRMELFWLSTEDNNYTNKVNHNIYTSHMHNRIWVVEYTPELQAILDAGREAVFSRRNEVE